jgi:hypothetical protein
VVPTSAALQELDLSAAPIGLDMPDEDPKSFRRQTLLSLDLLRGALLALLALESIQLFLRSEQESDENWYSKQDRWTESPLYALRLLAVRRSTLCVGRPVRANPEVDADIIAFLCELSRIRQLQASSFWLVLASYCSSSHAYN